MDNIQVGKLYKLKDSKLIVECVAIHENSLWVKEPKITSSVGNIISFNTFQISYEEYIPPPEPKEYWINIYNSLTLKTPYIAYLHDTEELAKARAYNDGYEPRFVKTIKIVI